MARGGRRAGTPGKTYGNRSDLNRVRSLPNTPPSKEYGQATALQKAQQAVPVAPQPVPGLSGPSSGGSPATAGGAAPNPMPAAAPPAPGSLGDLLRPTENPGEPVTHGLPFGPGGGPEVLGMNQPAPNPLMDALASLNSLGSRVSPVVNAVRAQANALAQANPTGPM